MFLDIRMNLTDTHRNLSSYASLLNGTFLSMNHTTATIPQHQPTLMDPSVFLVWFIAVSTIVVGGYLNRQQQQLQQQQRPQQQQQPQPKPIPSSQALIQQSPVDGEQLVIESNEQQKPPKFNLNSKTVAFAVVIAFDILLILYFLYKHNVCVLVTLFALLSHHGVFCCVASAFNHLFPCIADHRVSIPFIKTPLQISSIFILIISIAPSMFWFYFRNECHIWILQVTLAVSICITLIREYQVSSLKTPLVLLVVMVFYDVFTVFVTRHLTANGRSMLNQVAPGVSVNEMNGETMPIVIKVPKLIHSSSMLCSKAYSLLELGYILLPGPFVSLCRNFDLLTPSTCPLYFSTCCFGYGVGLMAAFFDAMLMGTGRHAALYISLGMLLGVVCVGFYRGELNTFSKTSMHVVCRKNRLKTEFITEP